MHKFKAIVSGAVAFVVPIWLIVYTKGYFLGWIVGGVLAAPLLGYAGYHWYKYKKTPETTPDESESFNINDAPPEEQIRLSKKAIGVMVILGPFLSIMTYSQLSGLERGTSHVERVWVPVAILYQLMGFWPAVLCWPIVCGAVIFLSFQRIKRAKSMGR
jgi:hypothetical protein